MGRSHRGTRDGVDGVLAAGPGGQNVQARGEDVSALAVVGEVGTLISESRSANSHSLLGSSRRVATGVGVVITSSNGEVNTGLNTSIDSNLQSSGLATTKTHVGNAALEALGLAILGSLDLLGVRLNGPLNTLDDIRHGTRARRSEDLDSVDVGLLGDTVLLANHGSGAVGSMSITILILIVVRDGLAPVSTALEVDVVNVDTSVNGVGINALAALTGIQVLVKGAEGEAVPVGDTSETPGSTLLDLILFHRLEVAHGVDLGVFLDELNLDIT